MTNTLEFPISIALIGAPDSGKSEVAAEFEAISADWFKENESEFRVLPNAGDVLQEDYDVAMGVYGSYFEDLRAFFLGYEMEQLTQRDNVSYLSVSTAFENLAHAGVNLETILTGLQTQQTQKLSTQGQIAMSALTFFMLEKFRFSFGFYIPVPGSSLVLPGTNEDSFTQRIDMALRQIFTNFQMRVQVLDQPTPQDKAQEIFDTVKRIVENGPDEAPATEVEEESLPVAQLD